MTWYEAILLTIAVFVGLFAVLFVPLLLAGLFDRIVEGIRRKKHPEYFKYWDESLKLSIDRGAEYNQRKARLEYYFKTYTEGLREGECTVEFFHDRMSKLMDDYKDLCIWFREKEEEIRELLVKADIYAKEHNCNWGVIYDSKRT